MNLTVGRIIWARRTKDDIYWPGKITIISNNSLELFSNHLQMQCNYLVHFFVTNQSIWINDILPYQQYRDCMTHHSFIHYGLHPTIKQDFLNAINQADYACSNEIYANNENLTSMIPPQQQKVGPTIEDDNIDNDFLLTPSPMLSSNTGYYTSSLEQTSTPLSNLTIQSTDCSNIFTTNSNNTNQILTTNDDWYSQQGLLIESITPPLPTPNDHEIEYISSSDNFQKTNSFIIITTKTYSNSSFISYLFKCLFTFYHRSIFYIDDLTNYQQPNTSNITYLICLDHFDTTIKQILDTTILNNLNIHMNYLFLVINAPSNLLITHLYSTVMDKRTIVILHYHSTFDNDPLLLCSGDKTIFEMIESSLLKYLCSKVKYIESTGNTQDGLYSAYCISSIIQSANILNHFVNEQVHQTLNEKFELDFLRNNQNILDELFPQLSINKSSNRTNLLEFVHNSNEDILKNKSKQVTIMNDLFQSGAIQTNIYPPICEYYVQNILDDK